MTVFNSRVQQVEAVQVPENANIETPIEFNEYPKWLSDAFLTGKIYPHFHLDRETNRSYWIYELIDSSFLVYPGSWFILTDDGTLGQYRDEFLHQHFTIREEL